MKLHYIPNIITIIRIILIIPIVWALLHNAYKLALGLFMIAALSDALDGFLARYFSWKSWLGSVLDPIADKLLMVICFILLGWQDHIAWWLVILALSRDLIIIAGAGSYHLLFGRYAMKPNLISKFNTFLQMLLVWLVILSLAFLHLPPLLFDSLEYAIAFTAIVSIILYFWAGIKMLKKQLHLSQKK